MDFPLHTRQPTWRHSELTQVTLETLAAYAIVLCVSLPAAYWLAIELSLWDDLAANPLALCKFVLQISLWVIPYTWCYFLALRKISRMSL